MKKYNLALDWTPNINHIGIFIAQKMGFLRQRDIDLNIISPVVDNYIYSPAKKLELGVADFALCPTETIISYRTKEVPCKLYALLTIFKEDVSAIAVRNNLNITRPKDLDGKSYASYGARYEDSIVRQLIKNDGGSGKIKIFYPERLGVWNTVLNDKYDSTWIFMNWEGIQRPDLVLFKLKNYDIPYSYSPLIVTSENFIQKTDKNDIHSFIDAIKEGYKYSMKFTSESIKILEKYIPKSDSEIDLLKALEFSQKYFGEEKNFGVIDIDLFTNFLEWAYKNNIEKKTIKAEDLLF